MKFTPKRLALAIASAGLLTISGCGGGGGSSGSSVTLSGVAASGAAFTDAIITVKDSTGATVGTSTAVGADGTYTITLSAGAVAPFILTASRTSADGAVESLTSVVSSTSGTTATVNITPVTNLIASRLTTSGDPLKLAAEMAANPSIANASAVDSKVQEVQAILDPILTATGTSGTNPITGSFSANGAGYDRLLDSIKVSITPSSTSTTNIEIGIKQQLAEGTPPTTIQFNNQTAVASIPVIPTITASTLVESGTASLIAQHLAQLNSCFALPLTSRIVTNGTAAADIQATECKNSFYSNSPSTFKSNGNAVGLGKAFNGIFTSGGTGLVFSQGTYEFTRGNGDLVIGYKSKDTAGNETFDTFAVRKDTDGKLKQIGNQYDFAGGVSAYHQLREFVNQPASTYYSTGYTLNVPLITTGGGQTITHVIVRTPKNNDVTLIRGSDGMVLPKLNASRQTVASDGTTLTAAIPGMGASGTNYIRLRSAYAAVGSTAAHPATRETGLFFTPTDATEAEITTFPNQSLWSFKYYSGGTAAPVLEGTQYYKTRSRALTITEMQTKKWANLSSSALTDIAGLFDSTNNRTTLPTSSYVQPTWEVPSGALPPTQIKLFGSTRVTAGNATPRTSFNDGQSVGSTIRTASIPCANGSGEVHCLANPATGYQSFAFASGLHLWARDVTGNEFARFYATYNLP